MVKLVCRECKNPLHIVKGGQKVVDGKIINTHVYGCLNPDCGSKMIEQGRTEVEQEQFQE